MISSCLATPRENNSRTRHNVTDPTLAASAVFILSILFAAAPATAQNYAVNGPRVVAQAITVIESLCDCVITYEDARDELTVENGTASPFEFAFDLPLRIGAGRPEEVRSYLTALLEKAGNRYRSGSFQVNGSRWLFYAIPRNGSILPLTVITLRQVEGMADELIDLVLSALQGSLTPPIRLTPTSRALLHTRIVQLPTSTEPVATLLFRLLAAAGDNLSWRLLYDPAGARYDLDIYAVPDSP